jgi:hypothetical protein
MTTTLRLGRSEAPTVLDRVREEVLANRVSLAVLGGLLAVGGLVQGIGMAAAPQRIDDEGTYVAQAWAVENLGTLGHYTYWYDHPPAGWLQLAGWTTLTDAFDRSANAVLAGRELMLVVQLVSMVLLWVLARRVGLARWSSAVAVGLFALSPLAVQFHRTVFLDNLATPWILGAFVLALSPQRRLGAYAASGACFAVAVLTKETSLLLLPALAWLLWREVPRETRRYALSLAASLFVLIGGAYVLYATVKSELMPSSGQTSLMDGIRFQLGGREGTGALWQEGSRAQATVDQWLNLDPVLPLVAVLAAVVALVRLPRLRPLAAGMLLFLAVALRPGGYLPVPYVIAALPLGALVVGGAGEHAVALLRRERAGAPRWVGPAGAVLGAVLLLPLLAAAPTYADRLHGLTAAEPDQAMVDAQGWIERHVPRDDRVITDDAIWVDLVEAGFETDDVVWYYKVDTDPEVQDLAPEGWRDYDWLVSTESFRSFPENVGDQAAAALDNSIVVATFGEGASRVEVRRVVQDTSATQDALADHDTEAAAGQALATNPNLELEGEEVRGLLEDGLVDERLLTLLAALAGERAVTLVDLPAQQGEDVSSMPRRTVELAVPDAADREAVVRYLEQQQAPFAPSDVREVEVHGRTVVRATLPVDLPDPGPS